MSIRIDHVSVAVRDLEQAVERFRGLGFEVSAGGPLTGTGLRNAIIPLGQQYLQLLTVDSARKAVSQDLGGPPLVNVLEQHEGGLVGYAVTSSDLEGIVNRVSGMRGITGITVEGPYTMRRQVSGGEELIWRTALPGGMVWRRPWPSLVEWETPEADRSRLAPLPEHANGATGIAGVSVAVANLETAVTVYRDVLGFDAPALDEVPALVARRATFTVGGASVRLLTSAGGGPVADYLAAWGEGPFEVTLATSDVERTRQALAGAEVTPSAHPANPDWLLVPPDALYGVRMSIEGQRSVSGAGAR